MRLKDMQKYWEARAAYYHTEDVFGRTIVRNFLEKLKPRSLIEIGCGTGELFQTYKSVSYVVAIDWSKQMLERAQLRKARHSLNNIHLLRHDICQSAPRGHFDIALTRTVLMHLPDEEADKAARHMIKLAKKLVIFEYFEDLLLHPLAPHCWLHDYVGMFTLHGCELLEAYPRPDQPQVLFVFQTPSKT
jgi:SAM-dependent methyltransferase